MIHYPGHIPQIPLEEEIILTKQENDVNPFLPKCREYGIEVGASGWFMFLKTRYTIQRRIISFLAKRHSNIIIAS